MNLRLNPRVLEYTHFHLQFPMLVYKLHGYSYTFSSCIIRYICSSIKLWPQSHTDLLTLTLGKHHVQFTIYTTHRHQIQLTKGTLFQRATLNWGRTHAISLLTTRDRLLQSMPRLINKSYHVTYGVRSIYNAHACMPIKKNGVWYTEQQNDGLGMLKFATKVVITSWKKHF